MRGRSGLRLHSVGEPVNFSARDFGRDSANFRSVSTVELGLLLTLRDTISSNSWAKPAKIGVIKSDHSRPRVTSPKRGISCDPAISLRPSTASSRSSAGGAGADTDGFSESAISREPLSQSWADKRRRAGYRCRHVRHPVRAEHDPRARHQLPSVLQTNRNVGMQTMDDDRLRTPAYAASSRPRRPRPRTDKGRLRETIGKLKCWKDGGRKTGRPVRSRSRDGRFSSMPFS